MSEIVSIPLSVPDVVDILTAHPPARRIDEAHHRQNAHQATESVRVSRPIGPHLFVGRQQQLNKLCSLQSSYALVGPRAIVKTSLINRATSEFAPKEVWRCASSFGVHMIEYQLLERLYAALVDHYEARASLLARASVGDFKRSWSILLRIRLVRLVWGEWPSSWTRRMKSSGGALVSRRVSELHNSGRARFVLAGYKDFGGQSMMRRSRT